MPQPPTSNLDVQGIRKALTGRHFLKPWGGPAHWGREKEDFRVMRVGEATRITPNPGLKKSLL
jgi:hypothetical protein